MLQTWYHQTVGGRRSFLPFLVSLFQNLLKWWSPAFPARPWLFHLRSPEGRVHSPLPPHQRTSLLRQQRALPRTHGPPAQAMALGHGAGQAAAVRRLLSPEPTPRAKLPPTLWNYKPRSGCTMLVFPPICLGRSRRPSWQEQKKLASFGKKSARCIPGFGMNRHMD